MLATSLLEWIFVPSNSNATCGAAVVAGGDPAPVLEAAKHDLDAAATPVAALVVPDRLVARLAAWDAGLDAFGLECVPEPVGVVAAVPEQPLRLRHVIEQRCRAGVVADVARGHEEAQGGGRSHRRWRGAWCSCRLWSG